MAEAVRTLYGVLMLSSSAASVGGNALLLLVLLLNRELRSDSLGLTLSCSLSDLALGLAAAPLGAHCSLTGSAFSSAGAFCQGSGFFFLLLLTASIHSLAWATVHRWDKHSFFLGNSADTRGHPYVFSRL